MINHSLKYKLFVLLQIVIYLTLISTPLYAKEKINNEPIVLTDLTSLNITNDSTKNIKELENIIKTRKPRFIYLEQWITLEPHNKDILKTLTKLRKKYNSKLFLVVGKNTWFGSRGVANTLDALNTYGKWIDGIVLRTEPNKTNIWNKDETSFKIQILNQMLDAYSAIHIETKKRDKIFIAEFPFWFTDFNGPKGTFSQDTCNYVDRIVFLIDDIKMLDTLAVKWNGITCQYQINLGKRATNQTEESIKEIYSKIKKNISFYYNFNGFIIDSDSTLENNISF